jgi:hypothetical protein
MTISWLLNCQLRVRVTLLLAVHCQSVRHGDTPFETHDEQFFLQLSTCGHSPYVTSSQTRGWICRLQLLLVLASAVILSSESHGTNDNILYSQIRDSPSLEGQIPVFISPRNRVARLYPQALGSLSVSSYDSQGYGGGIRPRLHTGLPRTRRLMSSLHNTVSNCSSIVACVSVAAGTFYTGAVA